jgi:Ca2+:H+ antiporter
MFGFNYFSGEAIKASAAVLPPHENNPIRMKSSKESSTPAQLRLPPAWTMAAPVYAAALLLADALGLDHGMGGFLVAAVALGVASTVFAAVHHADVVAHRVGQPYGTLVLALAVTLIEVALIVSMMLAGGPATSSLARDTVFAAVMIILNGIVGLCLLVGSVRHREQRFSVDGVSALLMTLSTIVIMTLVFPNYTIALPGPYYSPSQLLFIAIVSLVIYGAFIFTQTIGHRHFFLDDLAAASAHEPRPGNAATAVSAILLLACLAGVVLLAEKLAPDLEALVEHLGAPHALAGVIVAAVVLLPEGLAALGAARANRLQTSLNLALGSAIASIGLTIPTVAFLSLYMHIKLVLGISAESTVLLMLSLFVTAVALRTARTNILDGVVLLVIFAVYLFTTIVP